MPYVAAGNSANTASLSQHLFVCPDDFDPHGATLGAACTTTAPAPGITSYLLNAYFLFGLSNAAVSVPASTIYVAERDPAFCDVHVHPWLGEIHQGALPTCISGNGAVDNLFAPAAKCHRDGANYLFADGHVKWEMHEKTIKPDTDQTCFGQYQALSGDPHS